MTGGRDPLTTALRTALAICAGCGWLAASIVLLDNLTPAGSWPLAAGCLAWLVFAPLYEVELANLISRIPLVGRHLARGVWILEVLPVFLLPTPIADALIFGSMVIAQGHLFLASEDDRNAARCLAAAPLVNVIALAYTRSLALLALLPVSGLVALVALVLLGGRAARRKVRRSAPLIEDRGAVAGRLAYAVPLAVVGLGLAALLFLLFSHLLEDPKPVTPGPSGPREVAEQEQLPDRDESDNTDASRGVSPEMAFAGSSSTPFSEEVVLRMYPENGSVGGPAVHLRDMVLDEFTDSSVRARNRRRPPLHWDAEDGNEDGWTEVREAGRRDEVDTFRIESRRLYLSAQSEWTLLFAPHPLLAIEIPQLAYHPDQVLFTPEVVRDWFTYRVRSVDVDTSPGRLRDLGRSRSVSDQYVQLPRRSASLDAITARAEEWTRGASSDYGEVAAIVGRLRSEFEYELQDLDFRGPDALVQFLDERKGYCTYFATAAAMMLRTRGIPARVATGFLAHEWLAEEGHYIVREKDAHAWIEVAFEEVGWVTFDPTPAGAQEFGNDLLAEEEPEEPPFSERMRDAMQDWLDDEGSLGAVLMTLLRWPAEALRNTPTLWLLPSALLFLLLHLLFRRKERADWDDGPNDLPRRTFGLFQRLAQVLARLGHKRRPSQTPREFARSLPVGVAYAAVGEATELYYRARFGGAPLVATEEQFVERVIEDLERQDEPQDPS